ncbi:MAG: hypothetical protein DYG98_10600 [Haliscomenobacteraceae bacterium CHB4]|nr:hypothetical protein [Haliscomenobacteraceae bacterium CHB4]
MPAFSPRQPSTFYHQPSSINMVTTKSLFAAEGLDERSLEFLANAIEKNNLPGFDYYEFKRAVVSLLQMKLDEATSHKSAFTTAATVGLTKEKLIETANYYKNIVEKEKEQFDKALENQNATKITARKEEVKRLRDQVERHKTEIARLQDEIAGYLTQIDQAEAATKLESDKLEKAKSAFEKTHQAVVLQIDKDIENMHKHL